MHQQKLFHRIESLLKSQITQHSTLGVNFGLTGLKLSLADGRTVAIKAASQSQTHSLSLEGLMLRDLAQKTKLPVPEIYHSDNELLIMGWIADHGIINTAVQHHAAELLAQMHSLRFSHYGYNIDTVIGPLHQPNTPSQSWIDFFTQQRMLYMARLAHSEGKLLASTLRKLEKLAEKLPNLLFEPAHPSLLHGDLWTGNIIIGDNQVNGFIDPAIYYGHPEIELAFTTLFGTFDHSFLEAYHCLRPLEPGFTNDRLEIYNLYPLLVHVRLFGKSYLPQILSVLNRHGL